MSGEPPDLALLSRLPDPFAGEDGALPAPPALPSAPSPTRGQHRQRLVAVVAVALVVQGAWIALSKHTVAFSDLSPLRLVFGLGAPLLLAIAVWSFAIRPGGRGLGLGRASLAAAILAAPLLFALTTLAVAPMDHDASRAIFVDKAVRCLLCTGALSAAALALAALPLRHAFAAASTWRTAAVGTACGALGAATMSVACFHAEALHVLIGHGSMMLVGGALGALLGRSFTRI